MNPKSLRNQVGNYRGVGDEFGGRGKQGERGGGGGWIMNLELEWELDQ